MRVMKYVRKKACQDSQYLLQWLKILKLCWFEIKMKRKNRNAKQTYLNIRSKLTGSKEISGNLKTIHLVPLT